MIIINKNELDPNLIYDINLELETLFTDNRTWEISSSTGDLDDASDVRIVIKGVGHCYISTIGDTEEYVKEQHKTITRVKNNLLYEKLINYLF